MRNSNTLKRENYINPLNINCANSIYISLYLNLQVSIYAYGILKYFVKSPDSQYKYILNISQALDIASTI